MRELKESFVGTGQVKGFIFTQIKKSKYAYIYKVDTGGFIHYEVFEHKENKQFDCISYPKDKSFGSWAWTKGTLESAIDKFEEIELRKGVKNGW